MTDARPAPRCDLVMKGGITSGVVYPLAVCELAGSYRFARIGGTSAGAIAAAFTAAAEARRRRGDAAGYDVLTQLPAWLGQREAGQSHLLTLFAPDVSTRRLYRVVLAPFLRGSPARRAGRALGALARGYPVALGVGASVGGALLLLAMTGTGALAAWAAVCGAGLAMMGALAGVAVALARDALRVLPANGFGMCTGMGTARGATPPLSAWIADHLDHLAGIEDPSRPLTFGDLASAREGDPIHLEMVTTCLTQGRPLRLPFDHETFLFDPQEMRRYFPERIVRHLLAHGRPARTERERRAWEAAAPLRPLPAGEDLPVAFAVRMSLSFPLLVSAIPLYSVDRSRRRPRRPQGGRDPAAFERCWFSDGGICSNFPVHFFDAPLPRWPTFGINLRRFHPDYPRRDDEAANVWMPSNNRAGILALWDRFDAEPGTPPLAGFVGAVLRTMQGWSDNTQIGVPGYRDRVVHVAHSRDEGGLNLDMDAPTIARLARRGQQAGIALRRRFSDENDGAALSWDNHRWVRLRTMLALLTASVHRVREAWESGGTNARAAPSYAELLERPLGTTPRSYPFARAGQRDLARDVMTDLIECCDRWEGTAESLDQGAPRPSPELRIRPR